MKKVFLSWRKGSEENWKIYIIYIRCDVDLHATRKLATTLAKSTFKFSSFFSRIHIQLICETKDPVCLPNL